MKTWTESAENRLEQYLNQRPKEWGLEGSAAVEMTADLRAHVHEELQQAGVEVVTLDALERVLTKLGGGEIEATQDNEADSSSPASPPSADPGQDEFKQSAGCLVGLVIVACFLSPPLALLLGAFAFGGPNPFFNTMPTIWHCLMIAFSVGVTVVSVNRWLSKERTDSLRWAGFFGANLVITGYYALLFLPTTPLAFVGTIFIVGWIALAPLSSFLWMLSRCSRSRKCYADETKEFSRAKRRRFWAGFAIALAAICVLDGPSYLTHYGVRKALSADARQQDEGLKLLRKVGSEDYLLRACWGERDVSHWVAENAFDFLKTNDFEMRARFDNGFESRIQRIRELYFKVTGELFESKPRPKRWNEWARDNRAFDNGLGGDAVAGMIEGLSLTESRIDGHLDAASQLSYLEWTCVFTNEDPVDREARFHVQLPPGGVVSRLTLWVNGEPKEAAFSSISQVKAAYKSVAVVQRRDPVLVNVSGVDRVFVQCFPVLRSGGSMQIRLGITAPLQKGTARLPTIVDRNFQIKPDVTPTVWMQAPTTFTCSSPSLTSSKLKDVETMRVTLPEDAFKTAVEFHLPAPAEPTVWTEDPFAPAEELYLVRTYESKDFPALGKPIIVLDSGAMVRPHLAELQRHLANYDVVLATDHPKVVPMKNLTGSDFLGATDNTQALLDALTLAQNSRTSAVLWIHGPQPLVTSKGQSLLQVIEGGRSSAHIYDLPLTASLNRIAEMLVPHHIMRTGPLLRDLPQWLACTQQPSVEQTPRYVRSSTKPETGVKVWDQLARYSVFEQLGQASHQGQVDPKRTEKAAKYQLVTPWSGAVVLETKAQYAAHGLEPVDSSTTPSIPAVPEPSTMALLLPVLWLGLRRKR